MGEAVRTVHVVLGLLAVVGQAAQMTDTQKSWYKTCHRPGVDGSDPVAWGFENYYCECKANPRQELAGGAFTVDSVCLNNVNSPPQGGVTGDLAGRVLWTLSNENVCTGSPFRVATKAVPNSKTGALLVSWAEDFDSEKTGEKNAVTHLTLFEPDGSGVYQMKKDLVLKGCAQNGGIVYNKRGDIATMCMRYCEKCFEPEKIYDPWIVEVKPDLSGEVRRHSVKRPECSEKETKFCYPKN
eukprot:Sspe_Gene.606::Locus_199_Transcript_1_2_Confidence_0.500_Length_1519::g.606::m.606